MSRLVRLLPVLAATALLCPSDTCLAADAEGNTVAAAKLIPMGIAGKIDAAGDVDWWYFQAPFDGSSNSYWSGPIMDRGGLKVEVYESKKPGVKPASAAGLTRIKSVTLTKKRNNLSYLVKGQHYYFIKLRSALAGKIGRYSS